MASRTTTDPIEILLEMGVDLDNLSEEEDYLSALKEAIATIQFQTKGSGDERSRILQEEVIKVRKKRKAEDSKFRAKKTVISADSIRPIRSPQLRSQKIPAQKLLPGAAQDSESEETKEKKKRTRKGKTVEVPATFITSVSKSVKSILGTLKQQSSFLKKTAEKDRKAAEREKRSVAETKLESKFFKPIIEAAQKVVAPVKGILSKIFDFFYNVFLAKVVVKIADWMSNPDNQRKVANTIRFLTDHGPKLLLAYILFGNRLGRFVTGLAARLIFGAARLAAAGFKLIAALPWWAKVGLAGTALFGAGAVVPKVFPGTTKDVADDAADALKAERGAEAAAEEITRQNTERNFLQMFGDFITGAGAERTEQADRLTTGTESRYGFFGELQERSDPNAMFSGGGLVQPILKFQGGGQAKFNLLNPFTWMGGKGQKAVDSKKTGAYSDDTLGGRLLNRRNATNEAIMKMRGYEQGGEVDGPGGVDKVPAMLTDGEFVMSRGAVQKYGLSTLESMNAAGGGTNKPKIVENTYYADGGGGIGPSFAEHSSDHSRNSRPSRTGGIDPGGILGRYVYGDQSIPNLIAQGKFKEALEALNIKLDINLDGVKQLIDNAMAGLQGLSEQVMSVATEAVNQSVQLIQNVPVMAQRVYDQAMVGAAQLYDQSVVLAGQAKEFVEGIPAALERMNPLSGLGRDLERRGSQPSAEETAIAKLTAERIASGQLGPEGKGLTKDTQEALKNHDNYIRSLYAAGHRSNDPSIERNAVQKFLDQSAFGRGLQNINADIQNRGLIPDLTAILKTEQSDKVFEFLSGGRLKNMGASIQGFQMTQKGMMGPLGRMFRLDDMGSLSRYARPAMEHAQSLGVSAVNNTKFFNRETLNDAPGSTNMYNKLLPNKIANLALGQFNFDVDESGRAVVTDDYDASTLSAEEYHQKSRAELVKIGKVLQGKGDPDKNPITQIIGGLMEAYKMNKSAELAAKQNLGQSNIRPIGLDVDMGGGFLQTTTKGKVIPNMTDAQRRLFDAGGGGSQMDKNTSFEEVLARGERALKPQLEKERASSMDLLMGGKDAYYSSTTGRYYRNYAEALKDPRVKAAAQVEETKKKLSFAPTQQPNLTIPGTPVTQRPKVTITNIQENASSGGNSSTSGNNPVPSIPMPPASSSKTKVLGFLPEPLQFF